MNDKDINKLPTALVLIENDTATLTFDMPSERQSGGEFWISEGEPYEPDFHFAFSAATRNDVDAFYAAAIAAGGIDNGKPGLRSQYHPNYYATFIQDHDGYNIEAVCHLDDTSS